MKLLAAFFRLLYGTPKTILIEDLHARFIGDWLEKPSPDYIHPHCIWTLGEGYPQKETFIGTGFHVWYASQLAVSDEEWTYVISELIGSSIGAITVGTFHIKNRLNGLRFTAPFINFYRVQHGKIVKGNYVMGKRCTGVQSSPDLLDMFPANSLPSLN